MGTASHAMGRLTATGGPAYPRSMTTDAGFDPDRSAPRPARPMGIDRHPEPAVRAAVPHDRHDRGRAGARATRCWRARPAPKARRRPSRPRSPRRLARGVRSSSPAAAPPSMRRSARSRSCARRSRGRAAGTRAGRRAGVRVVTGPAGRCPGHRRLARGRDHGHERGALGRARRRGADRAPDRVATIPGCGPRRPRRRDPRARPELVPHHRLSQPDAGSRRDRRPPVRTSRSTATRWPGSSRVAPLTRPGPNGSPAGSRTRRTSSSSRQAPIARPVASSCSRSRRPRGCRPPTAISRRSSTATSRRPIRRPGSC